MQQNVKMALHKRLTEKASEKNKDKTNTLSRVKSTRTKTVDAIQQRHRDYRNAHIKRTQQRQTIRRNSVQARVQARKKAKQFQALAKTEVFADLDDDSRNKIIDAMEFARTSGIGTTICEQGGVADMFYLIVSGRCAVVIDGASVAALEELTVFGESALFPDAKGLAVRGASVITATEEVQLLTLTKVKFDALVGSGALNKDCVEKLKTIAAQRVTANEHKAAVAGVGDEEMEHVRMVMGEKIKTVDRCRKIVGRMNKDLGGVGVVGGDFQVSKLMFVQLVNKIVNNEKKVGSMVLDKLWLSVCASEATGKLNGVTCDMLETWMGLAV
jgi:CRP-like cAMP-binding protein